MLDRDLAYVMAQKTALVQTVTSSGWSLVKQIANQLVDAAIQDALDAEDNTGEGKRLKASALKKGFGELFSKVESATQFNPQVEDANGLGELEMEFAVNA